MNSRSSASQNQSGNKIDGKSGKSRKGSPSHLQKRWQPKQRKAGLPDQTLQLSQAEQDLILRQRALLEAQQGNYDESIALFNQLIDHEPQNANYYSNRGLVYFQDGQAAAALADYNQAIELNPRLDSAYNNRANYYVTQGMFLEAILDYDIALDLNPANVRAWINQGITFRDLELYDRALESFEMALCLGKLEGHVYAEQGRTYHLRGDWNCAVGDYYRALESLGFSSNPSDGAALRLYLQVESWLDELLSPLRDDEDLF
jgi:tetratricopeptide (TPR) repeat protein